MKIVSAGLGTVLIGLLLAFLVCTWARLFAWRMGSTPSNAQWLRQRLPVWLLKKLRRIDQDERFLWVHFLGWMADRAWMTGVGVTLLWLIVAVAEGKLR